MVNACETPDGAAIWDLILICERQMRVGMSGAYALDLPAFLTTAEALDLDLTLLLDVIADIEPLLLFAWRPQS